MVVHKHASIVLVSVCTSTIHHTHYHNKAVLDNTMHQMVHVTMVQISLKDTLFCDESPHWDKPQLYLFLPPLPPILHALLELKKGQQNLHKGCNWFHSDIQPRKHLASRCQQLLLHTSVSISMSPMLISPTLDHYIWRTSQAPCSLLRWTLVLLGTSSLLPPHEPIFLHPHGHPTLGQYWIIWWNLQPPLLKMVKKLATIPATDASPGNFLALGATIVVVSVADRGKILARSILICWIISNLMHQTQFSVAIIGIKLHLRSYYRRQCWI